MQQISLAENICAESQVFFYRKWMKQEKKPIRSAIYKGNATNYRQCRPSNNKNATKFGMRFFNGTSPLRFPKKVQNFKHERRDFTHS